MKTQSDLPERRRRKAMSKAIQKLRDDKEFVKKLGKITDQEIADMYGIKLYTVREIRKDLKIKAKRHHKFPVGIELYAGKMPDVIAAQKLHCHPSRIFLYRIDNDIEPYRKQYEKNYTDEEIIADYEALGTLQKVGDKHGITRERVRQILNQNGYKKRLYNFRVEELNG